jgi:hypothetical protein
MIPTVSWSKTIILLCVLSSAFGPDIATVSDAKAVSLRLEIEPLAKRYCTGDKEGGTVHVQCVLRFMNVGSEPLLLYKGSGIARKQVAARSKEDLRVKRYALEGFITTVYANLEVSMSLGPRPGSSFVILTPGKTFETKALIAIPVKWRASNLAGLMPGHYLVQIEVETWPESPELGEMLHERWKKWGSLWFEPYVTSEPLAITIERDPKTEACE